MKKYIILFLIVATYLFANSFIDTLKVGMHAPDWIFQDSEQNSFTMDSWKGKVLQINYVDPDKSDLNESFNNAIKKAIEIDSMISRENFKGFGIVDCKSSWKPDFAIRAIAGKKAKKFKTTILFDYDAKLRKLWGLKENSYNVIILDKNRICRAIYRGKIEKEDERKVIQLISDLQKN